MAAYLSDAELIAEMRKRLGAEFYLCNKQPLDRLSFEIGVEQQEFSYNKEQRNAR